MKLEKYFECKNESKNIFLICFPENRKWKNGEIKIIEISFDYKIIKFLKSFNYYGGLISSIEIKYNNNYYYLNFTQGIILWDYDYNKNIFDIKNIIPKNINENIDFNNFRCYKEIIYLKNRNLLIIQNNIPKSGIYFFL